MSLRGDFYMALDREPHARFDGGELEKEQAMAAETAALGKPRELSPAPTARHLARSLPYWPH